MTAPSPRPDSLYFRKTLGHFATGILVVTTSMEGQAPEVEASIIGLTINSFTSVSLEPALVLWCLDHGSNRYQNFIKAQSFGLNVLGSEQKALSERFARQHEPLSPKDAALEPQDPLRLSKALAYLKCRPHQIITAGDHDIIIAQVLDCTHSEGAALTYFKGQYGVQL